MFFFGILKHFIKNYKNKKLQQKSKTTLTILLKIVF